MAGTTANSNSGSFSTKHPTATKVGKFVGQQAAYTAFYNLLDKLLPENYAKGVQNLMALAQPAWGFEMEGAGNVGNIIYAYLNDNPDAMKANSKQLAANAGLAYLSAKAPLAGTTLAFMKNAYDAVQSGKVDHAANRQYLSEFKTGLSHLLQDADLLQKQGYSDEDINRYLTISIQSQYASNPTLGNDLMRALNGEENFTVNSLTLPVPNSAYQELKRQQAQQQEQPTVPATNENTNTGGIIPTAAAAGIPEDALNTQQQPVVPATPNTVQQPQALSQLVNGGNIWTTGDASKAKSGVTWSMAVPNSEQYQRLKASADFANSLNSYKNRTDLSDAQKEQMAIADLIALNL